MWRSFRQRFLSLAVVSGHGGSSTLREKGWLTKRHHRRETHTWSIITANHLLLSCVVHSKGFKHCPIICKNYKTDIYAQDRERCSCDARMTSAGSCPTWGRGKTWQGEKTIRIAQLPTFHGRSTPPCPTASARSYECLVIEAICEWSTLWQ